MSDTDFSGCFGTSDGRVNALKELFDARIIEDKNANTLGYYVTQYFTEVIRALPTSAMNLDLAKTMARVEQSIKEAQ